MGNSNRVIQVAQSDNDNPTCVAVVGSLFGKTSLSAIPVLDNYQSASPTMTVVSAGPGEHGTQARPTLSVHGRLSRML